MRHSKRSFLTTISVNLINNFNKILVNKFILFHEKVQKKVLHKRKRIEINFCKVK